MFISFEYYSQASMQIIQIVKVIISIPHSCTLTLYISRVDAEYDKFNFTIYLSYAYTKLLIKPYLFHSNPVHSLLYRFSHNIVFLRTSISDSVVSGRSTLFSILFLRVINNVASCSQPDIDDIWVDMNFEIFALYLFFLILKVLC